MAVTEVPPFTERELSVLDAARRGVVLPCSTLTVDQLADDEDSEHEVRAELLRELLIGLHGSLDPRGVRLEGARIVGTLDLAHLSAEKGLGLRNCFVPMPVVAPHARLPWLSLAGSRLAGVFAEGLCVEGDLQLADVDVVASSERGAVVVPDARVGGVLDLMDAKIVNDSGPALLADSLEVASNLRLDNLRAGGAGTIGTIQLSNARVRGQISLVDAEVTNDAGPAVIADRLQVGGHVHLQKAHIAGSGDDGAIWLLGAQIDAQLNFGGARITNNDGPAVIADSAKVGNDLRLDAVWATGSDEYGTIRLPSARIGGLLDVTENATITNDMGPGLHLGGAEVGAEVFLPAELVCGRPQVRGRCTGTGQISFDGFTFAALHETTWREWLHLIRFHTSAYRPGPYQQLAAVERAAGHDGNARRILIAQQRDLYRRAPKELGNWLTRRFHWLWGKLAGYGYLARRTAAALLFALALAGGLGYWAGHVVDAGHHTAERPASFDAPVGKPCTTIELVEVGLDRGLPLSPTGVRTRCDLNPATATGGVFTVAIWLVQAAVWGLATLALAGYTGLVRKIG